MNKARFVAIIYNEYGNVLVGRQKKNGNVIGDIWGFISGDLEGDEAIEEILKKEVERKTNLIVSNPKNFYIDARKGNRIYWFVVNVYFGETKPAGGLDELKWLYIDDLYEESKEAACFWSKEVLKEMDNIWKLTH